MCFVIIFALNGKNAYSKKLNNCQTVFINMMLSSAIGNASKISISHVLGCQKLVSFPIMFLQGYFLVPNDAKQIATLIPDHKTVL